MRNLFHFVLVVLVLSSCAVSKSTKTIHPFTGNTTGCGNFIVYKLSEASDEYVSIIVDVTSIELIDNQTYGIGKAAVVKVTRKKFDGPIGESLCSNTMAEQKPNELIKEEAIEGTVQVLVSEGELEKAEEEESYNVTVILRNVVFDTVSIDYLRLENVNVGWLPR